MVIKNKNFKSAEPDTPEKPLGLVRSVRQPLFEKDLMAAGTGILGSMTQAILVDDQDLIDACMYLGQLTMVGGMENEINMALWKINGTMAIQGKARRDAVQAHVGIYFPDNATKEDKKRLEKMQYKRRDGDDDGDKQER